MLSEIVSKQLGNLALVAFADAYTNFVLSRQAMQCTKATLEFYRYTAAKFLAWAEGKGARESKQIDVYLVRQLLQYRRTIKFANDAPLFLSRTSKRLTGIGVLIIFRRLSQATGIHITPHALRRTFVVLSLRSGMDVLHLQAMLGHASLDGHSLCPNGR
jgi:site-specific recombinase XerD